MVLFGQWAKGFAAMRLFSRAADRAGVFLLRWAYYGTVCYEGGSACHALLDAASAIAPMCVEPGLPSAVS
eukprot:8981468-Alexandrium_andersonii.AAC.1